MNKLSTAWTRRLSLAGCAAAALALAACGDGILDDDPPTVNLSASTQNGTPGQAVRLEVDVRRHELVYEVSFYRIEGNGRSMLLCTDRSSSFTCNTQLPNDAAVGSVVNFYARAWDSYGNVATSVNVPVRVVATAQ